MIILTDVYKGRTIEIEAFREKNTAYYIAIIDGKRTQLKASFDLNNIGVTALTMSRAYSIVKLLKIVKAKIREKTKVKVKKAKSNKP